MKLPKLGPDPADYLSQPIKEEQTKLGMFCGRPYNSSEEIDSWY